MSGIHQYSRIYCRVKEGNIEEAYKVIGESSALPAICGRVCPQESSARANVSVVSKVKLFLSVNWKDSLLIMLWNMISNLKTEKKTDIKLQLSVPVRPDLPVPEILQKLGYDVTVFEALHELGGVLVYGIPEFRLPKEKVVKKEIEKLKSLVLNLRQT